MIKLKDIKTNYQQMDDIGRAKFEGYCMATKWCKFSRKSKDEFAHWDVSYYSGDTVVIGEIKDRKCNSDDYSTWILQEDKLNELKKIKQKVILRNPTANVKVHYINFFEDNEMFVWDITDMALKSVETALPKTYCGDTSLKNKQIIYLPTNTTIINTTNGK